MCMAASAGGNFSTGAQKFAVGGVTAMALFEMLQAELCLGDAGPARRQADQDESTETVQSPDGNGTIKGYLARPAKRHGKLPAVLVIHENRGLNPYIEDVARRLAVANFIAFAPDGLTSVGGYPGDEEKARGAVPGRSTAAR